MFHTETSSVVVSFSTQLGEVAISIMNLPTGEVFNETVNSIFSTVMIPIAGSAGIYIISFLLSNEERYYGQFEIPPVGSIKNESSSKMAGKMR